MTKHEALSEAIAFLISENYRKRTSYGDASKIAYILNTIYQETYETGYSVVYLDSKLENNFFTEEALMKGNFTPPIQAIDLTQIDVTGSLN